MKPSKTLSLLGAALLSAGCAPEQPFTGQIFADISPGSPTPNAERAANNDSAQTELVQLLMEQLGVNPQQAQGGAGAIFALAQQRMNPADFMQLSSSLPAIDQYLASVPASPTTISWSSFKDSLPNEHGRNWGALSGSFQRLGLDDQQINQFIPIILQYVQSQAGPAMIHALQAALIY